MFIYNNVGRQDYQELHRTEKLVKYCCLIKMWLIIPFITSQGWNNVRNICAFTSFHGTGRRLCFFWKAWIAWNPRCSCPGRSNFAKSVIRKSGSAMEEESDFCMIKALRIIRNIFHQRKKSDKSSKHNLRRLSFWASWPARQFLLSRTPWMNLCHRCWRCRDLERTSVVFTS